MHVADINPKSLRKIPDQELLSLNRRLHQLWGKFFSDGQPLVVHLKRKDLLQAARYVFAEMKRRNMNVDESTSLYVAAHLRLGTSRSIMRHAGGKTKIAGLVVGLFPEHKVYVEPFVGGGSIVLTKWKSEREIVSDINGNVVWLWENISSLTDDQIERLKKMNWVGSRERFFMLRRLEPKMTGLQKLYVRAYLLHFSWMGIVTNGRVPTYDYSHEGNKANIVDRWERLLSRMSQIEIYHEDYASIVERFDSRRTFFYFDPPYKGTNGDMNEKLFDEDRFLETLKRVRGKFLVTSGVTFEKRVRGLFSVVKVKSQHRGFQGKQTEHLFVSNYL